MWYEWTWPKSGWHGLEPATQAYGLALYLLSYNHPSIMPTLPPLLDQNPQAVESHEDSKGWWTSTLSANYRLSCMIGVVSRYACPRTQQLPVGPPAISVLTLSSASRYSLPLPSNPSTSPATCATSAHEPGIAPHGLPCGCFWPDTTAHTHRPTHASGVSWPFPPDQGPKGFVGPAADNVVRVPYVVAVPRCCQRSGIPVGNFIEP
jgi:hypothetical protein